MMVPTVNVPAGGEPAADVVNGADADQAPSPDEFLALTLIV